MNTPGPDRGFADDPDQPGAYAPPAAQAKDPWKIAAPIAIVVALAAVVVAILAVDGTFRGDSETVATSSEDEVLERAREIVCLPHAFSYRTLDRDEARAQAVLMGMAKARYTKLMANLRPGVLSERTAFTCRVDSLTLESRGDQAASVVARITVDGTSPTDPPVTNNDQRLYELQKVNGTWLISSDTLLR